MIIVDKNHIMGLLSPIIYNTLVIIGDYTKLYALDVEAILSSSGALWTSAVPPGPVSTATRDPTSFNRRRWRTAPYYHLGPSDSSQVLRLNILLTTLRLFLAFLACGHPLSCFSSEVCRQRDVSHELPQLTFPRSNGRYRLCPSLYTFHSYQRFFPLWHARPKHTCNS